MSDESTKADDSEEAAKAARRKELTRLRMQRLREKQAAGPAPGTDDLFADDDPNCPDDLKDMRWVKANLGTKAKGSHFRDLLREHYREDVVKFRKEHQAMEKEYRESQGGKTGGKRDEGTAKSLELCEEILKRLAAEAAAETVRA